MIREEGDRRGEEREGREKREQQKGGRREEEDRERKEVEDGERKEGEERRSIDSHLTFSCFFMTTAFCLASFWHSFLYSCK